MLIHNPSVYFQQSEFLTKGLGNDFTETMLKEVFRMKNKNLLYIFNLKNGNQNSSTLHKFAVFAASSFPLPNDKDYNKDLDYFTFEQTGTKFIIQISVIL